MRIRADEEIVRLGIVGVGFIAETYIRLIAENKVPGCKLCAMSSRNKTHMETIKTRYQLYDAILFTDYEAMLCSGLIDAVLICTPHLLHVAMAEMAVQKQIHALVEKPIGVYADEAEELVKKEGLYPKIICGVMFNRRASNAYGEIKALVDAGELGQIRRVNWILTDQYRTPAYYRSKEWRGTWNEEGGGVLMNQAVHHLDVLNWLFGEPEKLQAFCSYGVDRDIEVENEAVLYMWYPNHMTAQFVASSREFPGTNRLEISGSKGQLILENEKHLIFRSLSVDERSYAENTDAVWGRIPVEEKTLDFTCSDGFELQIEMLCNFVQSIKNQAKIYCPVSEAIGSLNIVHAAYLSAGERTVVEFPVDNQRFRVFFDEIRKK